MAKRPWKSGSRQLRTIPVCPTLCLRSPRSKTSMKFETRSTTIICVRKQGKVALAGDGQVTLGDTVIKHGARKIRRLYNEKILAGFAGSSADSFALFSRFEAKMEQFHCDLSRAAVSLATESGTARA